MPRDAGGKWPGPPSTHAAGRRLAVASVAGVVVAGVVAAGYVAWQAAELIGWDVAAGAFLLSLWVAVGRLDAGGTERVARNEDPSAPLADLVIVSAAIACIVGSGLALTLAGRSSGGTKAYLIALAVSGVIVGWASVHSVFTLRYARLYYGGAHGGLDFQSDAPQCFVDFAYVAFTVAMTFQVSDTDVTAAEFRRTILRHALSPTCSAR